MHFSDYSMEFLQLQNLLCFFLLFLSLSIPTKADVDEYFVHCGSSSNTTVDDGRIFIGDSKNPGGVRLLAKNKSLAKDTGNQSELYKTAVIFNSPGSYQFGISNSGTYILRLHFYAFLSSLNTAQFNVSASGHLLLSNFNGKASFNSHVLKEFLLTIDTGAFNVFFVPSSSSSVAFVNAIELFIANTTIGTPVAISSGLQTNLVASSVLMPVHRINVGGQTVSSAGDMLWREWLPDDPYLVSKASAIDGSVHNSRPDYQHGNATEIDAPETVYKTAKELNVNSSSATWNFNVSRNSIYFLRVHFCDIISEASGVIIFNLFIYKDFGWKVDPFNITQGQAAPFYLDFLVKSDGSGFVNVSIGSRNDTITANAFLNGLEIMEVISASVVEPEISDDGGGEKGKTALIVGLVAGGIGLICVIFACLCCISKRKKARRVEDKLAEAFNWPLVPINGGGNLESKVTERTISDGSVIPSLRLKLRIPFVEIQQITNNFDEGLVVGEGGFGKVYKGVLKNGMKVAVKRSDSRHGQGFSEFLAEVNILSKIRHRHLVQLIGYCDENNEMVLVYEFMERGSLRDHLYNSIGNIESLSWTQRLEICIGAAKGLHYLHTGSIGGIIHRDVKSSNILLDENHVAKVSDFGLSRLNPLAGAPNQEDYISTDIKGTFGYLDPEYCQCLQLTEKSDVYSFGVVLLEVLCVRQAVNRLLPEEQANLADWAMTCKASGEVEMIVDPTLSGKINPSSLKKFLETAEKCLRESGVDRPPMSDVLWDLEYASQLQKHGVQQERYSSSASTTDVSINMAMLAIPSFNTNSLPISMNEMGSSVGGMSGLYGASGEDLSEQSRLDHSYNRF